MIHGLILIVIASLCQGTMGLGQKRFKPMSWESYWFLFSILSMLVVPYLWQLFVIPDHIAAMKTVSFDNALFAAAMGALWGIGALMWAKALVYIGLSLTYGIGMSMSAIIGSLGVLFDQPDPFADPSTPYIILGIFVMVVGVAIVTVAGVQREKMKGLLPKSDGLSKKQLVIALLFAFCNGIFSGGLNLGFVKVKSVADAAIAQGATTWSASLTQWQFVFIGGFIIQAGFALIMICKNKSFSSFTVKGANKAYITCLITSFLWFAALALYGQASAVMGDQGPVIGWTMYVAFALIVSNALGLITGEWRGAKKPLKLLWVGNIVLLLSWVVLGYANSL